MLLNAKLHIGDSTCVSLSVRRQETASQVSVSWRRNYPFTLIFENDNTAVPGRGLPINVAGRKVVKINMFLI